MVSYSGPQKGPLKGKIIDTGKSKGKGSFDGSKGKGSRKGSLIELGAKGMGKGKGGQRKGGENIPFEKGTFMGWWGSGEWEFGRIHPVDHSGGKNGERVAVWPHDLGVPPQEVSKGMRLIFKRMANRVSMHSIPQDLPKDNECAIEVSIDKGEHDRRRRSRSGRRDERRDERRRSRERVDERWSGDRYVDRPSGERTHERPRSGTRHADLRPRSIERSNSKRRCTEE